MFRKIIIVAILVTGIMACGKSKSGFKYLCGSQRISALSALDGYFYAEGAEVRREPQRRNCIITSLSCQLNPES